MSTSRQKNQDFANDERVLPGKPVGAGSHGDARNEADTIAVKTELKQGRLDGAFVTYGPDGRTSLDACYVDGALHGLLRAFDEKGRMIQDAQYENGKQNGLMRVFALDRVISEQTYRNGLPHGLAVTYSDGGDLSSRQTYVRGVLSGESVYMLEGKVVRKCHYVDGMLEGKSEDFDRDGNPMQVSNYKKNRLDGTLTRFYPDGKKMEVIVYKAGKPVGPAKRYNLKGIEELATDAKLTLSKRLEKLVRG